MERFNELLKLYESTRTVMSAICVAKGGIDVDNYVGRFFAADFLELLVAMGERYKADKKILEKLKGDLASKKDLLSPGVKPIHEMSLEEFEKMVL